MEPHALVRGLRLSGLRLQRLARSRLRERKSIKPRSVLPAAVGLGAVACAGAPALGLGRRGSERSLRLPDLTATNIVLGANILVFILNYISGNALVALGCKHNGLIAAGQTWRLLTPVFLHAGLIHLLVNCQALSVLGPFVESLSGTPRYAMIYVGGGIAGTLASYKFNPAPSIGASGAIFGLSGALMCFAQRHKRLPHLRHFCQMLQESILRTLAINTIFGLIAGRIDNWGHGGGFLGGYGVAYLLGPALVPVVEIKPGKRGKANESVKLADRPPLPVFATRPSLAKK